MLVAAHHRRPKGAIVDAAATVAFAGRGGLVQVLGGGVAVGLMLLLAMPAHHDEG